MCTAMIPVLQNGPVDFCLSPGVYPPKGSYVFSSSVGARDIQRVMLHYFFERGWRHVAILTTTDTSGQTADEAFKRFVALPENHGAELVADEHYAASDLNINAQIARIKAANADAVMIFTPGAAFGTALRSMHDLGLDIPVGTSAANEVTTEMQQYGAFLPKQVFFPGVSYAAHLAQSAAVRRQQQTFERAMQAAGLSIDLQAGVPWDPALIEIDALRHVGITATPAQLLGYIEGLHAFPGITGTYDFTAGDQRGIGINAIVVMEWSQEKTAFIPVSGLGGVRK
jgi:branched-chain amino acid transport system substrate-binding protein